MTLTFEPSANQVRVGDELTLSTVLTSTRHDTVYVAARCGQTTQEQTFGPVPANPFTGVLAEFRDQALSGGPPTSGLIPDLGCPADYQPPQPLAAGSTMRFTETWRATSVNGSVYDGPVVLTPRAVTYFLDKGDANGFLVQAPSQTIRLSGGDSARATWAEAIDAALADPTFAARVEAADPSEASVVARYSHRDPKRGNSPNAFVIHLVDFRSTARSFEVVVDPVTRDVGPVQPSRGLD